MERRDFVHRISFAASPSSPRRTKQSGSGFAAPAFGFKRSPVSGVSVTQQFARGRAGALVVGERLDAVDDDRAIALRMLHAAPFAAGQILRDFADPIRLDV